MKWVNINYKDIKKYFKQTATLILIQKEKECLTLWNLLMTWRAHIVVIRSLIYLQDRSIVYPPVKINCI